MPAIATYLRRILAVTLIVTLTACQSMPSNSNQNGPLQGQVYCIEVVSPDPEGQCQTLAKLHGLSFGDPVAEMGGGRIATRNDGTMISVRAPLAEHEQPIIRTYLAVPDIEAAVKNAEAEGAMIAYPPTQQGDTGTWAIYIQDGVQHGLWQK